MRIQRLSIAFAALGAAHCGGATAASPARETTPTEEGSDLRQLERLDLNRLAVRRNVPLFWVQDVDEDGAADPDEVRSLLFYPAARTWVDGEEFTDAFRDAYAGLVAAASDPVPSDPRRALVRQELDAVAPRIVDNDLRALPDVHRRFAAKMLEVAHRVDDLYATQTGMAAMADRLPEEDVESRSLFRRNWGVHCRGATTEAEEACSALEGAPDQPVDVYPAGMQEEDGFCRVLEDREDAEALLGPFTVVRERGGEHVGVPYHEAYADASAAIAAGLREAAAILDEDPDEVPLAAYLRAAAEGFTTNDWLPADEAWSQMNALNSRWYVRVGPDEVYWDPCSHKAGYHLTLALINRDSLDWQTRLTPLMTRMEDAMAEVSAGTYEAREVAFHLPDFIDIVINAGDDRDPFGATIGQSLPNWGPVRNEGRGRTVAMTNLYQDLDSQRTRRQMAEALFTEDALAYWAEGREASLMSTILHEATHNLGPLSGYTFGGETPAEAFGGGLASMLEELKAQSGALFLLALLGEGGILDETARREAALDSMVWAMGHISRGMYTPSGQRKAYSQLAAIQVGFLMARGALRWDPTATAANGTDQGAFDIEYDAFPAAARDLMGLVMRIKATNDRSRALELADRYVDGDAVPQAIIQERYRRFPQASFVYALRL